MTETINDATAYGVQIKTATVSPGNLYWKAVKVHHLTPGENGGNHHVFADVLDGVGNRVFDTRLLATWLGGYGEVIIDKPLNEPGTNVPMWKWQVYTLEVKSDLPSDRVINLHTAHPDEEKGNTLFHHSFMVVFQKTMAWAPAPPAPPAPPVPGKALAHYILFGPPGAPGTRTNFIIAQDYILKCGVTCGFSPNDALNATRVTIVGDTGVVNEDAEQRLRAAGCQVFRIVGDSYAAEEAFKKLPC